MRRIVQGVVVGICLGWTMLFHPVSGQSQSEELVFRNLDEELGLSNANVLSIIRDSDGMMWYGTAFGLYRYDGTRVKSFFNSKDTTSISHNTIIKLAVGPDEKLWVKNVNGTYDVYDHESGKFTRGSAKFTNQYHLASDTIGMVMHDRQGRFWFTHTQKGISIFDPSTKETQYLRAGSTSGSLASDQIAAIAESPDGMIWAINQSGIIELIDPNRLIVTKTLRLPKTKIPALGSYELVMDSEGDAWIFDPERDLGVFWVDGISHEIMVCRENEGPLQLNNDMVKAVVEVKKGQIWLGTDHGGINQINKESKTVRFFDNQANPESSMPHNVVYALYKDSEEIVWIGTHKKGVSYYHQGLLRFSHVRKNFSEHNSLPFNDVNAFVEDSLGNLYIGTNGGGLFYHDRKNNRYKQFRHNPEDPKSLTGDVIVDLMLDHEGILWIGTYLNGLGKFDGHSFTNFRYKQGDTNGLPGPNIWKLFEDSKHRIWIGTLRSGMSMLSPDRRTFHNYPAGSEPFRLHNQYITGFAEDLAGNIWISGGSGLNVINYDKNTTSYYSETQGNGLREANFTELFADAQGVIWLTTQKGLHYFDPQDSLFVHYGQEEGLPSNYLVDVLDDDQGNLWISSQNGLTYAQVKRHSRPFQIVFQNFDQKDGLQASLFNKNSAIKTKAGEFLFGGPNGYNIFKSENFAFEQNNPAVVFTYFQLFNENVEVGEEIGSRVLLTKTLENTEKLVLKHDENMFSIGFSALNFLYPEKNKYRYKLIGFTDDWIYLNDELAKVTFTNLDPGNYTLVVQPGTVLDGWSTDEYKLAIVIQAPFWRTPIAYFLYLVVLATLAYFFRNQLLTRHKEKLERENAIREAKRVQELDKLKTKFFTNLSHEFRTPLSLILTPAEHLISISKDSMLTGQYKIIQRNARRLLKLINQLLDVKNVDKGALAFHPSEGDIVQFVRESIADFNELSENQNIQLRFESDLEAQQAIFDSDKLEKIIFNLLSNTFKFTPEDGKITVKLDLLVEHEEKGVLSLSVSDTGVGISAEDQKKVFDRFFTTEGHGHQLNQGSGIGLSLAQDFAKIMGGVIEVESELGKGSTFTLTMPIGLILPEDWDENTLPDAAFSQSQKDSILIVEDHREFRNYLKDCLSESYQVLTAANGMQAWEIAQEQIPDLVISDWMMPMMDGKELCQRIKGDMMTSHIPVILLTAKKSEENLLRGLDSGCNLYLTKPFNLEVLQLSVKNLLRERKMIQEQNRKKIEINATEVDVVSMDDLLIQKAVELVEKHLDDTQLSVEFLSSELGMSRVHLYKKLQSLTGKSPIEFIRLIRMQRAAQLLTKSQLNVAEVAYRVGYNNAKYFAKHFKAEFEVLPSEYSSRQLAAVGRGDQ
ncbi:hybrid sensor histidine kinase/response regulator transcription factor [Algoriphagus terrigena]|uniref:hybrid sensor histidine kinase/response regulator transcription factor n=1 Tax=Algoriphagus terrigena TaxID=344884 RepID=UPI0004289D5F|nr:two-component regulator propeller domain-containing protein [Algoriphagus terrigena]